LGVRAIAGVVKVQGCEVHAAALVVVDNNLGIEWTIACGSKRTFGLIKRALGLIKRALGLMGALKTKRARRALHAHIKQVERNTSSITY